MKKWPKLAPASPATLLRGLFRLRIDNPKVGVWNVLKTWDLLRFWHCGVVRNV
jgi:hypothetical protein